MRYLVLLVVVVVAAWFFFRSAPAPEEAAPVAPPSPEKQFAELLGSSPVDATRLAALCNAYPRLAAKLLEGKQIKIKGAVEGLRVSGLSGRRAEVLVGGGTPRKLVLVCDLDQYRVTGVDLDYLGRFQAAGTELLYTVDSPYVRKVVTFIGEDTPRVSTLNRLGASETEFRMVDGPRWAGAIPRKAPLQHMR